MVLIRNGTRFVHAPMRFNGGDASDYVNTNVRNLALTGMQHNLTTGYGITSQKIGVPSGCLHPYSWIFVQKAGGIGAINICSGSSTQYGKLTRGVLISANLVCPASTTYANAGMGVNMVSHLTCPASIMYGSLTFAPSQIYGYVTCNPSVMYGHLVGDGWLDGAIFGSCSLSLVSYATGRLQGVISPYTVLSPENLATAVWSDVVSKYPTAGTTGKALASAGSAGDPWGTMLPGLYPAGTAGYLVGEIDDVLTATSILKGLAHENFLMKDQVYDGDKRLLSATVRIYANATDCANDVNPIEEYAVTSSYGVDAKFRMVKI